MSPYSPSFEVAFMSMPKDSNSAPSCRNRTWDLAAGDLIHIRNATDRKVHLAGESIVVM